MGHRKRSMAPFMLIAFSLLAHAQGSTGITLDELVDKTARKFLDRQAPAAHRDFDGMMLGKSGNVAVPSPRHSRLAGAPVQTHGGRLASPTARELPRSFPEAADAGKASDMSRRGFAAGVAASAVLSLSQGARAERPSPPVPGAPEDSVLIQELLERSKANQRVNDMDRQAKAIEVMYNNGMIRTEDLPESLLKESPRIKKLRPAECNLPLFDNSEICRIFDGRPSGTTLPPGLAVEEE